MLQGSLVALYRRCGKKGCRCERGEKHGPAYCLSYKERGVTQMVYIPASRLGEVKKAMEAFSRYWELGVKLSRLNLEQMGEPWTAEEQEVRVSTSDPEAMR